MEMNIPEPESQKFIEFWKAFPIDKGDRSKAREFWKTLHCEKIADQIIASVKSHAMLPDWQKDNGQWIPSIWKFLENRQWERKLALPKTPSSSGPTGIFAPGGEMDMAKSRESK